MLALHRTNHVFIIETRKTEWKIILKKEKKMMKNDKMELKMNEMDPARQHYVVFINKANTIFQHSNSILKESSSFGMI